MGSAVEKSRTPPHDAARATSAANGPLERDATATTAAAPPIAEAAAAPPAPDELEPFRAARRLHEGSDPTRAVAAWDSYLRAFPSGKLAVEARFNRALSLVRAGRTADAERALTPFAAGEFGSYRRSDAGNLLRLLRQSR